MSKLERLGRLDMTWLQIERETNLMQVVGVLVLETPLDRQRLETLLRARLLRLERFSQHVLRDSAGAIWESGQVDMSAHIVALPLPAGDEQAALEAVVSELAATPLDPQRPLWQLHLVGQYRQGSGYFRPFTQQGISWEVRETGAFLICLEEALSVTL